jgi:hypothetical protein
MPELDDTIAEFLIAAAVALSQRTAFPSDPGHLECGSTFPQP